MVIDHGRGDGTGCEGFSNVGDRMDEASTRRGINFMNANDINISRRLFSLHVRNIEIPGTS
jgi:hypothetical protein